MVSNPNAITKYFINVPKGVRAVWYLGSSNFTVSDTPKK